MITIKDQNGNIITGKERDRIIESYNKYKEEHNISSGDDKDAVDYFMEIDDIREKDPVSKEMGYSSNKIKFLLSDRNIAQRLRDENCTIVTSDEIRDIMNMLGIKE